MGTGKVGLQLCLSLQSAANYKMRRKDGEGVYTWQHLPAFSVEDTTLI